MIVLAVHSSSPRLAVALADSGRVLREEVLPPAKKHLENLAPLIKELTYRVAIGFQEIDGFGVAIGPGSFSGIRVGLATVKGMALASKKPVVGVGSLEIIAMQGLNEGESAASVIDARRNEIYAALWKKENDRILLIDGPVLGSTEILKSWADRIGNKLVLCGESVVEQTAESNPELFSARVLTPSAAVCARIAWQRLSVGDADHIHTLTPRYIRKSDAQEKRESSPG